MEARELIRKHDLANNRRSQPKILNLNPNFLHPEHLSYWVHPYFNFHPDFHDVGDRVVNIRIKSPFNQIPFGQVGTVVGVIFQRIEVVFDKPFIGGTNLGGRCNWLHGAMVEFTDVFNLTM